LIPKKKEKRRGIFVLALLTIIAFCSTIRGFFDNNGIHQGGQAIAQTRFSKSEKGGKSGHAFLRKLYRFRGKKMVAGNTRHSRMWGEVRTETLNRETA